MLQMRMPGCERAFIEIVKLRDYVLNLEHEHGQNKARVFVSVFGMTAENAEELRQVLLSIACNGEAVPKRLDGYGQRYELDFEYSRNGRTAIVRSAWIIRTEEDFPRLTSCYVV